MAGDAPIVLNVSAEGGHADLAVRITNEDAALEGITSKKIFQGGTTLESSIACKANAAFAVTVANIVGRAVADFAAHFQGMLAASVGNVVAKNISLIRCGKQRPTVISTEGNETIDGNFRHTEVDRRGNTGINTVGGGVHVGIDSKNGLVESIVAGANHINKSWREDTGPIETKYLGTRFGLRFPKRLKDLNILFGLKTITNKVATGDAVVHIGMPIDLDEAIVFAVRVGEAELETGTVSARIRGKQRK